MADPRINFLWVKLKDVMNYTQSEVENWSRTIPAEKMKMILDFFSDNDKNALFIFVTSRSPLEATISDDPKEYPGKDCIFVPYFLKVEQVKTGITPSNIENVLSCGVIIGDPVESFHTMFTNSYKHVLQQSITHCDTDVDQKELNQLVSVIERKSETVSQTIAATRKAIILEPPNPLGVGLDSNFILSAARDDQICTRFAASLQQWCSQIQSLLSVTEQVRQEDENSGPRAEMDYWRERMSIFSSLIESIKSQPTRIVISVLKAAKHPSITLWNELDIKITESANEAKDNVKYLSSLEKYTELLYVLDPPGINEIVPGLISSVSMVHSISRYYKSSQRICTLLKKVTNQMINACCKYINNGGLLHEQDRNELIKKFQESIDLNKKYQEVYDGTMKKKVVPENEEGTERILKTHYIIFGKFDTFSERCSTLIQLFTTIDQYNKLKDCRIEGISSIVENFKLNDDFTIRSNNESLLNPRNEKFNSNYENFKVQCSNEDVKLRKCISNAFSVTKTVQIELELYESLKKTMTREEGKIELEIWFKHAIQRYNEDLDNVRIWFTQQNENPPIPKNLPPITGKIAWVRQLISRINNPMEIIRKYDSIFQNDKQKKMVTNFNKLLTQLLTYEKKCQNQFNEAALLLKKEMQNTLLKVNSNNNLTVNFSQDVMSIFQEANVFQRLGFQLPKGFDTLLTQEQHLKNCRLELMNLLNRYENIIEQIHDSFEELFSNAKTHLDNIIEPGGQTLTWSSLSIDKYLETLKVEINKIEEAINKVNDIRKYSINKSLQEIINTSLIPDFKEPILDSNDLIDKVKVDAIEAGKHINAHVQSIQSSVCEILTIISEISEIGIKKEDGKDYIYQLLKDDNIMVVWTRPVFMLFKMYDGMTYRAILKCFKNSIYKLINMLTNNNNNYQTLFYTELKPTFPELTIQPNLNDLQQTLNEVVKSMLNSTKEIQTWPTTMFESTLLEQNNTEANLVEKEHLEQDLIDDVDNNQEEDDLIPAQEHDIHPKNYFTIITRDNIGIALLISMTNKMQIFETKINEYILKISQFSKNWENENENTKDLDNKELTIREIKEQMDKYLTLEINIESIEEKNRIGPILLNCECVKQALISEAKKYKQKYGDLLNKIGRQNMIKLSDFMEKMKISLSKNITSLEDLRIAMESLQQVRSMESEIDIQMEPIDESYTLLNKYNIIIPQEELEQYEGLTYNWKKLRDLEQQQQEILQKVSPQFKDQVIEGMDQFLIDFKAFIKTYNEEGPMVPGLKPAEASERLKIFQHQFDNFQKRWETYSGGQKLFGLPLTKLPELDELSKQFKYLNQLYGLYNEVNSYTRGIRDVLWVNVKFEEIEEIMSEFQKKAQHLTMKDWAAYQDLQQKIDNFVETMPLLQQLSNPAVHECHWKQIIEITGCEIDTDPDVFRLGHVFNAGLLEHKDEVESICSAAIEEAKIFAKLKEIESEWQTTEFTFANFKDMKDVLLKGAETNEIVTKIEDSVIILSSLNSNRFVGRFKKEVELWMKKLTTSSSVIAEWLQVQSMWIYLEAVFSGGDIARYMTHETKAFSQINKNWLTVMKNANDIKNVISVCSGDEGLNKLFSHLLEQLQKCQKALAGYIEKKRSAFPRFYFVSDPVILEILGQASNPQAIQPHLQSIFDNLVHLDFDQLQFNKVLGFQSAEGEKVQFTNPFLAQGNVEVWLNDLVQRMRQTIRDICSDMSQQVMKFDTEKWVYGKYPTQVLLLSMMIWWTEKTEDSLNRTNGKNKKILNETLQEFESRFKELIKISGSLDKTDKLKSLHVEVLITLFLHNLEIYRQLIQSGITSSRHFDWQKQMRYYWQVEGRKCIISITDVDREYSYEYLGCTSRLVITPLTDRCYITLAQALGLSMGGSPAGPAGTGKTETVKDMAKALGIMCVVFNCSDQMNYQALGRIFRGLAQSGVWGDFDEFNRIELDVLSVAAQQVSCIFNACRERQRMFKFTDGNLVELDNRVGIFITMNPGYAGRQELPENLKIQFRMVAMMVPDVRLIMKVKLASSGFSKYEELSDKFALLYQLCSEQLSKQVHYDWGLRNILSVLRFSKEVRSSIIGNVNEPQLLMKVLQNMNLSKLVDDDEPLFKALLSDVFTGININPSVQEIKEIIKNKAIEDGLEPFNEWLNKVIQLYETCEVRHGIMILGNSGSGKTSIIKTLVKSLCEFNGPHKLIKMNPKAITSSQMFGILDPSSNDWTDGIFSALWRIACKKTNENVWIELDGPVDAIWIENLNSVLDDNKTLTLANGDRLPMPNTVKLLFEVSSLDNASPATVSRAGMIYVPAHILGWKPLAQAWIQRIKKNIIGQKEEIEILMKEYPNLINSLEKVFNFIPKNLQFIMKTSEVQIITTLLDLFESLITNKDDDGYGKLIITNPELLRKLMIFSTIWSIGGFIDNENRIKLSKFICKENVNLLPNDINQDKIFNYVVDVEKGDWINWETCIKDYNYPIKGETPEFSTILIPTIENTQIEYLLKLLSNNNKSCLLFGDSGTAKTATINSFLKSFNKDKWTTKTFNFSSATTPYLFQTSIQSIVEKTIGSTYGPIGGKRMEVFIDDISMPLINEWGDQVTNEIVRQLMEEHGFYSLEKPGEFITIIKTQFLAAMCTPGGVLCFSPVGEQFRQRNLKFPGLFNCCTIDWFTHWPHQGLVSVAYNFISSINIVTSQNNDIKDNLSECFADIHESVNESCEDYFSRFRRRTFVTPKSYLSFLNSFKSLYNSQLTKIQNDASRMKEGLEKIREAKDQVAIMKGELVEQENQLSIAQQHAQQMLEGLTVKRNEAENQRQEVQLIKEEQQKEAEKIKKIQEEAQHELELAEPALQRATAALNSIYPNDITEIAGYASPPQLLKRIIDGVSILRYMKLDPYQAEIQKCKTHDGEVEFNSIVPSWTGLGQVMLKSSDFLKSLKTYNLEFINEEMCDLLQPYLRMADFNPQIAASSSNAAAGLCAWVRNMVEYHEVEKVVRPKKLAAATAQANLERAQLELATIEAQLAEKEKALEELQKAYDDAILQQQKFKIQAENTQKKLHSAQNLIEALSGEKTRWENEAETLNDSIYKTIGNAIIGSAFNSYCGMFNHIFRRTFLNEKWPNLLSLHTIPFDSTLNIISLFTNEAILDQWQLQGLPSDELSRQNGIVCTNAPTYPFLIDPQGQAHRWIIQRHKNDHLVITSFENRHFKIHVENAIQNGYPLLIEDCGEEIDPLLDNVLAKNYIKSGKYTQVSLGGREVTMEEGFTLYLTTKLPNPKFSPETFAKTAVIEFSVTQFGLEEQLLNLVILREKENLENERQRLLEQVAELRKTLIDLENLLLEQLRSSEGNLLENTTLITTLASTKQKSQENKESLNSAMETNQKITKSREDYRPVAIRGAVIYFLIQEMSLVNPMYQVSLDQFLNKFYESIEKAEPDNFPKKRIENIINTLTETCWAYIIRGLYEKDKLLFCLQLALKIEMSLPPEQNPIDFNDYQTFIKAGSILTGNVTIDEQLPEIFEPVRDNIIALSKLNSLRGFISHISSSPLEWTKLMTSQTPENDPLPNFGQTKQEDVKPFIRAIIIRCLRPDRAIAASQNYIQQFLGKQYMEFPSISIDDIAVEAGNKSPIIFLLSPGADPTPLVEEAARKAKQTLNTISMGQGREEFAENFINQSKHKGEWVLLQNCHLGLKYMETLFEKYKSDQINESKPENNTTNNNENKNNNNNNNKEQQNKVTNPNYRLWITTEVHPKFPISLLQLSIKLTNEPPAGARASMKRTLSSITQQMIDTMETSEWHRLIYILSFFNTTVQERRKFGPLGWCIPYEFNVSDFSASLSFMASQITEAVKTSKGYFEESFWQTIRYGICEIHYGGRVTDELDRRLIRTIGEHYFNNQRVFPSNNETNSFDGPPKHEYLIYDCSQVSQFIEKANEIPQNDPPDIFGLHSLADVKLRRDQANEIFQKIIDIQPKESSIGGLTRESVVLQKIHDLLPLVPEDFDMDHVRSQVELRKFKPLDICCKQEIERMQIVLNTLRSTLTDLELAIDGSIVMNDLLYNSMNSLYDGRIPQHWRKISWSANSLKDWFDQVKLRYDQYNKWIDNGKVDAYWLGGMFNPAGFLTSLRQETCRVEHWSLDQTFLMSEVQSPTRNNNNNNNNSSDKDNRFIFIKGLYLEGARWGKAQGNNNQSGAWGLTELLTSTGRGKTGKLVTDLRNEMPLIKLWTVKRDNNNKEITFRTDSDTYVCPVYSSTQRTDQNYVFSLPLKSLNNKAKHWVLRGVCMTTV
ncbi:Dynein heavy chain family protein [Histomonas meleagridis]|uniref:Dynein heavy chain family protein n=1 Tax=Histomonas meleagridis TaxID=135588 RepID=UPI00355A93DE|nr:Dynein heavy chain family protein [Histomonas meleagridis]KAH0799181.1 Dynein heavy chain family protein [Histomonas meleagridis]